LKNSNIERMMKRIKSVVVVSVLFFLVLADVSGQDDPKSNFISTAVPFLNIAPKTLQSMRLLMEQWELQSLLLLG